MCISFLPGNQDEVTNVSLCSDMQTHDTGGAPQSLEPISEKEGETERQVSPPEGLLCPNVLSPSRLLISQPPTQVCKKATLVSTTRDKATF